MKILVLDTETTDKPPKIALLPGTVDLWPSMVQFSFVMMDDSTYKYKAYDYIIKTSRPIENDHIHGITKSMNTVQGYDFKDIYEIYKLCIQDADIVVGHNLSFDLNMIRAECYRNNVSYVDPRVTYCTMMSTRHVCKLPNLKWATLNELHVALFHEDAVNLHNSLRDCIVCLRCYLKLMSGVDLLDKHKGINNLQI
jgi:DNA polymerase III epsilon subunit-like protein